MDGRRGHITPDSPHGALRLVRLALVAGVLAAALLLAVAQARASTPSVYSATFVPPAAGHVGDSGWATGRGLLILHTSNSGKTWTIQHGAVSAGSITKLQGVFALRDGRHVWAWGRSTDDYSTAHGLILRTVNGRDWNVLDFSPVGVCTALEFADISDGWTATGRQRDGGLSYGAIFRTTTGGRVWKRVLRTHNFCPMAFDARSSTEVICLGNTGVYNGTDWLDYPAVMRSTDGGRTWSDPKVLDAGGYTYVEDYMYNLGGWSPRVDHAGSGPTVMLGSGYLFESQWWPFAYTSKDHGETWGPGILPDGDFGGGSGLDMAKADVGYATQIVSNAVSGPITRFMGTTDGGATWTTLNVLAGEFWSGVSFTTGERGYIYGSTGIARTRDGGARWTPVYVNPTR